MLIISKVEFLHHLILDLSPRSFPFEAHTLCNFAISSGNVIPNIVRALPRAALCQYQEISHDVRDDVVSGTIGKLLH